MRRSRISAISILLTTIISSHYATAQHGAPVNAGVPSDQALYAPADRDSFDFVVFGDRTGGPADGVKILAQGVEMANRLDADLVLTVGDLVQGYCGEGPWLEQMREYKDYMSKLNMPWYPVPGNHDVYARPRRPGGNQDLYLANFGPLYYSFDYKWAHFIVLFSDESMSFSDPAKNQNFTEEQMEWLRRDLEKSSEHAKQNFVFLHHPRWTKRYDGCNWPEVHQMFVSGGVPTHVFAGHMHLYRSDGWIDNVRYYALATTGAYQEGLAESAGLHHINFVRVRPDGVTTAVLRVGSVIDGDFVLGQELDTLYELELGHWCRSEGAAQIGVEEGVESSFKAILSNDTDRAMRFTAEVAGSYGWSVDAAEFDRELAAGEKAEILAKLKAPALGEAPPKVLVRATAYYPLKSGLVQPMATEHEAKIEIDLADELCGANAEHNSALRLDGAGAVRVDVPSDLKRFTLECWAKGPAPLGTAALISKAASSSYGMFWCHDKAEHMLPTGYVFAGEGHLDLQAAQAWDWEEWTHLALVFDGETAKFFVDGKLQAEQKAEGELTWNNRALYIGAHPDRRGNPSRYFMGEIDEVRLSSVARYEGNFEPAKAFERDGDTTLLMHFDRQIGGLCPDDSGSQRHGWLGGEGRLIAR